MEDDKKKSAEEMKDDVKESSRVGTDSKTEAGGVSQKSKSVSSSATEQDLDVFLLGDLGDSDDGPGFKNSNWAKEKVAHVIFTSCCSNLKQYCTIPKFSTIKLKNYWAKEKVAHVIFTSYVS